MKIMKGLGLVGFFLFNLAFVADTFAKAADLEKMENAAKEALESANVMAVKAMVAGVVEDYKSYGAEITFGKINKGWMSSGPYFVFAISVAEDKIVAHGANGKLVGTESSTYVNPEGRRTGLETQQIANGEGTWIAYKAINPASGEIEDKRVWVVRIDDYVFGSGYYL